MARSPVESNEGDSRDLLPCGLCEAPETKVEEIKESEAGLVSLSGFCVGGWWLKEGVASHTMSCKAQGEHVSVCVVMPLGRE